MAEILKSFFGTFLKMRSLWHSFTGILEVFLLRLPQNLFSHLPHHSCNRKVTMLYEMG